MLIERVCAVAVATAISCTAATAGAASGEAVLSFKPVHGPVAKGHERSRTTGASPFVLNGTDPADRKDWRATVIADSGEEYCTATLVEPRIVLTAAHCLKDRTRIQIQTDTGANYKGKCQTASSYPADPSADYALCWMDSAIAGIKFERLSFDENDLKTAQTLTLIGYGCVQYPNAMYLGLRTGLTDIWKRPGEVSGLPNTLQTRGGAAVCLGDSGGGAYVVRDLTGVRRLAAINAKMDDIPADGVRTSSLAAIATKDFKCFARKWLDKIPNATITEFPVVQCDP